MSMEARLAGLEFLIMNTTQTIVVYTINLKLLKYLIKRWNRMRAVMCKIIALAIP